MIKYDLLSKALANYDIVCYSGYKITGCVVNSAGLVTVFVGKQKFVFSRECFEKESIEFVYYSRKGVIQ